MTSSTLYPPIVDTYMPIFLKSEEGTRCEIWFSYSPYMSEQCSYVQLTINDQKTNKTVLDTTIWPSGIAAFQVEQAQQGTKEFAMNLYRIVVDDANLRNGFQTQTYYRAQLRFISNEISNPTDMTKSYSEINKNLSSLSEWSTVTLLKCITEPVVQIYSLKSESEATGSIAINSPLLNISGSIVFQESGETETIKTCTLALEKAETGGLIEEVTLTLNQYDNGNNFNYKFKKLLEDGKYWLDVSYITKNGYSSLHNPDDAYQPRRRGLYINIQTSQGAAPSLSDIKITTDTENGRIIITAHNDADQNIAIVRSDSTSSFTNWEEVCIKSYTLGDKLYFEDRTIESGIWYKYNFQTIDKSTGARSNFPKNYIANPCMIIFNDTFLTIKEKQLKITFNSEVGSIGYNIQENKTDTIGSKYPWICRNGVIKYRSFPLSGLISYIDNNMTIAFYNPEAGEIQDININGLFYSKEDLFSQEVLELYQTYNLDNNINDYNDIILEKIFRDKVSDFLLDFKPRLFRNATEGNILVQLMNVSFTPNTGLKGLIYNFNCDAVEIDSCTIDNCDKYNIQAIGDIDIVPTVFEYKTLIEKVGQVYEI